MMMGPFSFIVKQNNNKYAIITIILEEILCAFQMKQCCLA